MIEVSEMTVQDLADVAGIEKTIFSQPWSRDGFEASVRAKNTIYLTARMDGEIAGYCGLLWTLDEAEITNVAVKEGFRRKGIADIMLRELLERGAAKGVRVFLLEVRQSNNAAIELYEKLGFESCGIRKNFYEKPTENAVIMWKH